MTPDGVFDTSYREPISLRGELDSLVRQSMGETHLPKVVSEDAGLINVLGWEVQLKTEQHRLPLSDEGDALQMRTRLIYVPIIGMMENGEYMMGSHGVIQHEIAERLVMPCVSAQELAVMEQMVRAYVSGDQRTPTARRPHRGLKPILRFASEVREHRARLITLLTKGQ
jgi:hypothetical protein